MQTHTSKDVFFVSGNQPEQGGTGTSHEHRLSEAAIGHPMLFYSFGPGGDTILEADVYAPSQTFHPETGESVDTPLWVHIMCPHCAARGRTLQAIKIRADRKAIEFDPNGRVPTFPGWTDRQMREHPAIVSGGTLSIERFKCTWERENDRLTGSVITADAICDFDVVVEKNKIRLFTAQGHLR